ncbi:MAG: 30S ribosomal protein S6e [Nanoarchaeota archaeon]|nr:30S ribosomal protein S6e [Nanoarchaeota archaeon]
MADFKLCIADPKSGKTYQKEVKDNEADHFIGKNIGETVSGDQIGISGYEFIITGGSDNCGFPMRKGILGVRKRLTLLGGVGLKKRFSKGIKKRKTVCGHKINPSISQINLKVNKEGSKKLDDIIGKAGGEEKKEEAPKKEEKAKAPKEEVKEEPKKEEKPKEEPAKKEGPAKEDVKEQPKGVAKKEEKAEAPKEEVKEAAKKEEKPKEDTAKKEEPAKEEKKKE